MGITGPVGGYIGHALWQLLGAGALGIPLLGIGLALAGFDRLGGLDMKRSAILIVGLSVLVPYVVGVLAHVSPADLDADVGQLGSRRGPWGWCRGSWRRRSRRRSGSRGPCCSGSSRCRR